MICSLVFYRRHNAICIMQALEHLQLNFSLDSEDIFHPSEPFMILILCKLGTILPKFRRQGQQVSVTGCAGANLTADLLLTNTHCTKPMQFKMLSFGSSNITVDDKFFGNPTCAYMIRNQVTF